MRNKKIFTSLLALLLLAGLTTSSFAEDGEGSTSAMVESEPAEVPVTATFISAREVETYYVDIAWEGMAFTYNEKQDPTWNPDEMKWNEDGHDASWTSTNTQDGCGKITVTNKSTDASEKLTVTVKFIKDGSWSSNQTVRMRMNLDSKPDDWSDGGFLPRDNQIQFDLAPTDRPEQSGESKTVYVIPAIGSGITASDFTKAENKLGQITISVATERLSSPPTPDGPEIFN